MAHGRAMQAAADREGNRGEAGGDRQVPENGLEESR
jgi:hypothetical protein